MSLTRIVKIDSLVFPSCHASDREEPLAVLIGLYSSKSLLLNTNISEYVVERRLTCQNTYRATIFVIKQLYT